MQNPSIFGQQNTQTRTRKSANTHHLFMRSRLSLRPHHREVYPTPPAIGTRPWFLLRRQSSRRAAADSARFCRYNTWCSQCSELPTRCWPRTDPQKHEETRHARKKGRSQQEKKSGEKKSRRKGKGGKKKKRKDPPDRALLLPVPRLSRA